MLRQLNSENTMPQPFDDYPLGGRGLLGKASLDNCRHGYGLKLMRITRQTKCGYCDQSLIDSYEHWLLMSVDHVLPHSICRSCGVPELWWHDFSNLLLCCSGCNGLENRYKKDFTNRSCPAAWTLDDFYDLRDEIFLERAPKIRAARENEITFFQSKPWNTPGTIVRKQHATDQTV
jgi:hypothetical protein